VAVAKSARITMVNIEFIFLYFVRNEELSRQLQLCKSCVKVSVIDLSTFIRVIVSRRGVAKELKMRASDRKILSFVKVPITD
jgi:hypothetical protein